MKPPKRLTLLDLFTAFYGYLGIRLLPLHPLRPFYLFWTLTLNTFLFIELVFCQPYSSLATAQIYSGKPLLNMLCYVNKMFSKGSGILTMIYFSIYGPRVVQLLGSLEKLNKSNTKLSKRNVWAIFLTLHLLIAGYFTMGYYRLFQEFTDGLPTAAKLATNLAVYINFLYLMLPLLMVHFLQYQTNAKIGYLYRKLFTLSCNSLLLQIQTLSQTSETLQWFLSLPFALYIILSTIDNILCICFSGIITEYTFAVYSGLINVYMLYIVHLGNQTAGTLSLIIQIKRRSLYNQRHISGAYQLNELGLYGRKLQFKIFSLCSFNQSFMLHLALFVLGNTVLILQTK